MKTATYDGKWKGEVIFYDPLTIAMEAKWEYAIAEFNKAIKNGGGPGAINLAILPGIFECVQSWHIKGLPDKMTLENFPSRPREERVKFINWLIQQVSDIYVQEDDPND